MSIIAGVADVEFVAAVIIVVFIFAVDVVALIVIIGVMIVFVVVVGDQVIFFYTAAMANFFVFVCSVDVAVLYVLSSWWALV